MKKLIILTTLLTIVYFTKAQTPATADASAENTFRLGLHFTPTIGFAKSDQSFIKGSGASLGYNFGLTSDFKLADNYYFATGIDVVFSPLKLNHVDTLRDTDPNTTFSANNVLLKYKLQYLGIPITLKLKTKEINYIKYYGQFGIEPQFNISKKVSASKGRYGGAGYKAPSATSYANFNDDIGFIRMALIIGGGIEYSVGGKTSLVAGLSYNGGFSDINKQPNSKITNSYVALTIGVLF